MLTAYINIIKEIYTLRVEYIFIIKKASGNEVKAYVDYVPLGQHGVNQGMTDRLGDDLQRLFGDGASRVAGVRKDAADRERSRAKVWARTNKAIMESGQKGKCDHAPASNTTSRVAAARKEAAALERLKAKLVCPEVSSKRVKAIKSSVSKRQLSRPPTSSAGRPRSGADLERLKANYLARINDGCY